MINMKKTHIKFGINFTDKTKWIFSKTDITFKSEYSPNNFNREIPELTTFAQTEEEKVICELGCGVGNVIFPL